MSHLPKSSGLPSEELFEAISNASHDAIVLLDSDWCISFWNRAAKSIFGFSDREVIGRVLSELIFPDGIVEDLQTAFSGCKNNEICKPIEVTASSKDGTELMVQILLTKINHKDSTYYVAAIQDLTKIKKLELINFETNSRLRFLSEAIEQSPATTVITDIAGNIVYANPRFEKTTGYSVSEAIGKNPRILKSGKTPQKLYQVLWSTILSGKTWHGTFQNKKKNGEFYWESAAISPVQDGNGKISHFIAVKEDITKRINAERELKESNHKLEEAIVIAKEMAEKAEKASHAKSDFLANMSHEIRTPMNGVIGMIGILVDTNLSEEQRRYAEIIKSSGESLLCLINDILDFSKMEAGKLDLEIIDFDLSTLLSDLVSTFAIRAQEKGLELLYIAEAGVPMYLRGDPGRLRQILTNLVGNAIKFTLSGEVTIRVARMIRQDNELVLRFSVTDTGIGIPEEKRNLLFGKFNQVDSSTTRVYGGTGLGLAISKQLAELMDGAIGVISSNGNGSEFWFTAHLACQTLYPQLESIPDNLKGLRILVVDDNATCREVISTHLSRWAVLTSEAHDWSAALSALYTGINENKPYHIAIIDTEIPGMDAETFGKTIHAEQKFLGLHLVAMSAIGKRGDANRLQQVGFSAYITKPIKPNELKAVLSLTMENNRENLAEAPIITRYNAIERASFHEEKNTRILIAEDNVINQKVAQGILKKLGYTADVVSNGEEAINALKESSYDLVLMDVQMPVMDGLTATEYIRDPNNNVRNHKIPIIAMTANAMQEDRERCLQSGMNDYVSKPIDRNMLAQTLEKWCRQI